MALSFTAVTGFSLLMGMSSALDTLSGQCYSAKQHRLMGIHMQRAMLVLSLVCIPLAIISANTKTIVIALGQNAAIAAEAGEFARFTIPSLFAYGLLRCLVRFLQTQNIVFPMMLSSVVSALLHIPLCWVLVFKSGLGGRGAALAYSISFWINVLLLALYVKFSPSCAKTWTGFSKEAFHNVTTFIRLAVPSAVMAKMLMQLTMSCNNLEMWSFEMIVLLSGLLPNPELETSVLSVSLNTAAMVWMFTFGLSSAVSTRVSNELGAGRPETARLAVCVVLVMAITEGVWWDRQKLYTYVATMMPILATSHFIDALQCVLSGTARGCGWQKIGTYVNLGPYYLVGIPSAILMAFVFHIGGKVKRKK
ncbi:protein DETOXIFICATION 16-like [Pyrus x bretschneideri]|uniref:protein DETOXIFICATION 16-like n=1 Tax=Pyrus x bretschneideri TaxID=225117 RepID=UPI00202FA8B0|nr:protein DETOXIFICATION 16-like [Pyrus x bretschneideri]